MVIVLPRKHKILWKGGRGGGGYLLLQKWVSILGKIFFLKNALKTSLKNTQKYISNNGFKEDVA